MTAPPPPEVLKDRQRRSVVRDGPIVVKRFHHPQALGRIRDGFRARTEFRVLERLHRAGVAVPRPVGVAHGPAGWEVRMESVENATPLNDMLRRREPPCGGWGGLLVQLGRTLAGLHAARVEHRDVASKNVLVDPAGHPWLIDFHDARIRSRPPGLSRMVRDIVAIAAAGREFLPPRLRLRFLAAWRRALPPDLRAVWNAGALAPHEIERRARAHRRDAVERGAERWLRTSSRTQVRHDGKRVLVTRRDLAEEGQFDDTYSLRYRLPAPEAKACWLAAARLHEHGIPVAVPARFEMEGPHSTVYFELPAPVAEQNAPRDLETILELLHDRGLAIDRLVPGDLLRSTGGAVALVPPAKLISSEI